MTRRRTALAAAVLVSAAVACSEPERGSSSSTIAAPTGLTTYVALGDSVAAGVGAADPLADGYVPLLADALRDRFGCVGQGAPCELRLISLAVSGATTTTVLRDQVPAAVRVLTSGTPAWLVTVTVGGNDVFVPVLTACAFAPRAPRCTQTVEASLGTARSNLDGILAAVTRAAPAATVAVMTYYNPVPACRLRSLDDLADRVLEGEGDEPGLNDVVREVAAAHRAVVVETGEALDERDHFVGGVDCLHPSGAGHERIAQAFLAELT